MHFKKIVFLLGIVTLAFTFTSCEEILAQLFGDTEPPIEVSIGERIQLFEDMLNAEDRTAEIIQPHFHETLTEDYGSIAAPAVFVTGPLAYDNAMFTITPPAPIVGDVITCTFVNGYTATGVIVFTMALAEAGGADYRIQKFTLTMDADTSGTEYTIKY
ncbi:MAG: hypothetical protein HN368_22235 [Spirochaetales bacterium]|nr:hypothetical protein [Spirochaetales bacterium]